MEKKELTLKDLYDEVEALKMEVAILKIHTHDSNGRVVAPI